MFLQARNEDSAQTDVQADMSLRWAHMSFCRFCHEAAHFVVSYGATYTVIGYLILMRLCTRYDPPCTGVPI